MKKIIRFFWLWCFVLAQNVFFTSVASGSSCGIGEYNDGQGCKSCEEGYICILGSKYKCDPCFPHSGVGSSSVNDCYAKLSLALGEESVEIKAFNKENNEFTCRIFKNEDDLAGTVCQICQNDMGYGKICLSENFAQDGTVAYTQNGTNKFFYPSGLTIPSAALFDGWYSDEDRIKKVSENMQLCGDMTLYPKIVCKRGYYEDTSSADGCSACPDGQTTVGIGAKSIDDCKQGFGYGSDDAWVWPDAVTPDEILIPNP